MTLGGYALGPFSDLSILRDYVATCSSEEEFLKRTSKLIAGSVGVVGTATSDYLPNDVCAGAAGRGAAEIVGMCEKELKDGICKVMSEKKEISAWMEKYILGDDNLRGGAQNFYYFEPTQNRYYVIKIICGFLIVVFTITLISRSRVGKFFKNIHPKKLYAGFKRRRQEKLLKNKEMLELLYAM